MVGPMNARALGLVVAVMAVAGAATPADAATTISGSLGGGGLPAKGAGVASVRAVAVETGVIADDARLRSGRFALRVPSGAYVLLAATTPLHGPPGSIARSTPSRSPPAARPAGCACRCAGAGATSRAGARRAPRRARASCR